MYKSKTLDKIFLNYESHYVRRNMMIDCEEVALNNKSSYFINVLGRHWKHGPGNQMPDESHYFIPKELVFHYVGKLMKSNKQFKMAIEEKEEKRLAAQSKTQQEA